MIKSSKKRVSAKRLRKECDLIMKLRIHERDGWKCVRCGSKDKVLQAAHVDGKGKNPRMRFEADNLLSLCYPCHMFWAHKVPRAFTHWFEGKFPERANHLDELVKSAPKLNLKELLAELRAEGE